MEITRLKQMTIRKKMKIRDAYESSFILAFCNIF